MDGRLSTTQVELRPPARRRVGKAAVTAAGASGASPLRLPVGERPTPVPSFFRGCGRTQLASSAAPLSITRTLRLQREGKRAHRGPLARCRRGGDGRSTRLSSCPACRTPAAAKVNVLMEAVDSNRTASHESGKSGLSNRVQASGGFSKKSFRSTFANGRGRTPLAGLELPSTDFPSKDVLERWAPASPGTLDAGPELLRSLPLDHRVSPAPVQGGRQRAVDTWRTF
ncbi:MAG: hypothetical protein MZV70_68815 [Desulfobacterales bacterium]|nr:hypothetical protein [Desulfobacterales bacterium]